MESLRERVRPRREGRPPLRRPRQVRPGSPHARREASGDQATTLRLWASRPSTSPRSACARAAWSPARSRAGVVPCGSPARRSCSRTRSSACLQVARSPQVVWGIVGSLVAVLVPVGVGALLLATVGGLFMSRRAMRPVQDAFDRQRTFIADASHELKTPLTLIRADAEVLSPGPRGPGRPAAGRGPDLRDRQDERHPLRPADTGPARRRQARRRTQTLRPRDDHRRDRGALRRPRRPPQTNAWRSARTRPTRSPPSAMLAGPGRSWPPSWTTPSVLRPRAGS